jgi:galactose-1-phosphate uridylyltransferase
MNPKNSSDSDTIVKYIYIFCEKSDYQTPEREIEYRYFFLLENLFSAVQVPEDIWKQLEAPVRKISDQNTGISLRIRIRQKSCGS